MSFIQEKGPFWGGAVLVGALPNKRCMSGPPFFDGYKGGKGPKVGGRKVTFLSMKSMAFEGGEVYKK